MVEEFTVFGSCASRDIFNSKINKDYKKYFKIGEDGFRLSFVSVMQDPVLYDPESIKILPENDENNHYSDWIKRDLDKRFLQVLKENNFDYIIIDTYFDVSWGLIDIGYGRYITKNQRIEETEFYQNLPHKEFFTIQKNPKKYLKLWKESCNQFFKFLNENCPDTKIILNTNRNVHNYLASDGLIKKSEKFQTQCYYLNYYRDILDDYIIKNFDVDVLEFKNSIVADENHFWSFYSLHFIENYFLDMTNQLNEIIERDKILNSPEYIEVNKKIRQLKRDRYSCKIENKSILNLLSKYNTARIDIKNVGDENNSIELIYNGDLNSKEFHPDWFKDEEGEGVIVESYSGKIDLDIKCVNDGNLNITLRSLDVKDKHNERFPIFIDYSKLVFNDEVLLNENKLSYHNKPLRFAKEVNNNEIVRLHIEWGPFTQDSDYESISEVLRLKKENSKIKNDYNSLKKDYTSLKKDKDKLKEDYDSLKRKQDEILNSNSWKITKPLRKIRRIF